MVVISHHFHYWTLFHPCTTSFLCNNNLQQKTQWIAQKTERVFVFKIVIKKNLSRFLEINLQLAVIHVAKTCLKQEIMKAEKQGSKIRLDLPIRDTYCKSEGFFYYLVFPQKNPLEDFQNSFPIGQKSILKLTTKPVIFAVRPVACAQENPLRDNILCMTKSTAQRNPLHD